MLLLVHELLVPPESAEELPDDEYDLIKTEHHVKVDLQALGHEVHVVGISDSLAPLRAALAAFKPHIVFNLLEEFADRRIYSHAVVSYLELMRVPYTGCNPRGLALAQDKAISKKILSYHRLPTPKFQVMPRGRKPKRRRGLEFPLIVKPLRADASEGLSEASVVHSDDKLGERVDYVHRAFGDALIEQYIAGRELYCGVMGYRRIEALPVWELRMTKLRPGAPNIATQKIKWDLDYQARVGVQIGRAVDLDPAIEEKIQRISKRVFSRLNMTGWARMDFRVSESGAPYLLEANPNGDIAFGEEFASSAEAAGYSYAELLQRVLNIGLRAAGK